MTNSNIEDDFMKKLAENYRLQFGVIVIFAILYGARSSYNTIGRMASSHSYIGWISILTILIGTILLIGVTYLTLKKDKKIYSEIKEQLKIFGAEKLIDKSIGDLSGGELQRVLLAIATKPTPNLLVLDEPVSGIDKNGTRDFYQLVNELKTKYDMSILLVSHDLDLVKKYADRVILLDKQVVKEGTPEEVFESLEFKSYFGEI